MKKNYYAVKKGLTPGIYRTWAECEAQVKGFAGAVFKGFATEDEARNWLMEDTGAAEAATKKGKPAKAVPVQGEMPEGYAAYVDGSFLESISMTKFGAGVVILKDGEIVDEISEVGEDAELAVMRNVAGEILASELAMRWALGNDVKEMTIFHDYEGIAAWATGKWKTNKAGTIAYKAFAESIREQLKVTFRKVKGHSGDPMNDLADQLAKEALTIGSSEEIEYE